MNDSYAQNDLGQESSENMNDPLVKLDIKSVKSEFGEKFFELRAIINQHDPIELIEIGCPEDEYDSEVKTIIVQLKKDMTEAQIYDLISNEFIRWFGYELINDRKKSVLKELAKDVYNWNTSETQFFSKIKEFFQSLTKWRIIITKIQ